MPRPKVDRVQLNRMLKAGKGVCQIARHFGVTPGAVSKAKKELNINVVKNLALESGHRVMEANLDAMAELKNINMTARRILDDLSESSDRADRALILKSCAEIRGQLSLQIDLFKTLYDMQMVQEFQGEVLDAIAEVSPAMRDRIVQKLKERRALRNAVQLT